MPLNSKGILSIQETTSLLDKNFLLKSENFIPEEASIAVRSGCSCVYEFDTGGEGYQVIPECLKTVTISGQEIIIGVSVDGTIFGILPERLDHQFAIFRRYFRTEEQLLMRSPLSLTRHVKIIEVEGYVFILSAIKSWAIKKDGLFRIALTNEFNLRYKIVVDALDCTVVDLDNNSIILTETDKMSTWFKQQTEMYVRAVNEFGGRGARSISSFTKKFGSYVVSGEFMLYNENNAFVFDHLFVRTFTERWHHNDKLYYEAEPTVRGKLLKDIYAVALVIGQDGAGKQMVTFPNVNNIEFFKEGNMCSLFRFPVIDAGAGAYFTDAVILDTSTNIISTSSSTYGTALPNINEYNCIANSLAPFNTYFGGEIVIEFHFVLLWQTKDGYSLLSVPDDAPYSANFFAVGKTLFVTSLGRKIVNQPMQIISVEDAEVDSPYCLPSGTAQLEKRVIWSSVSTGKTTTFYRVNFPMHDNAEQSAFDGCTIYDYTTSQESLMPHRVSYLSFAGYSSTEAYETLSLEDSETDLDYLSEPLLIAERTKFVSSAGSMALSAVASGVTGITDVNHWHTLSYENVFTENQLQLHAAIDDRGQPFIEAIDFDNETGFIPEDTLICYFYDYYGFDNNETNSLNQKYEVYRVEPEQSYDVKIGESCGMANLIYDIEETISREYYDEGKRTFPIQLSKANIKSSVVYDIYTRSVGFFEDVEHFNGKFYFASNNFIKITNSKHEWDPKDTIQMKSRCYGMHSLNKALYVFSEDGVYSIFGDNKIEKFTNIIAEKWCSIGDSLFFSDKYGRIYNTDFSPIPISQSSYSTNNPYIISVENTQAIRNETEMWQIIDMVGHDNKLYVATNKGVWLYNHLDKTWWLLTYPFDILKLVVYKDKVHAVAGTYTDSYTISYDRLIDISGGDLK